MTVITKVIFLDENIAFLSEFLLPVRSYWLHQTDKTPLAKPLIT